MVRSIRKLMMPGEAAAYEAYNRAKEIVHRVASKDGYRPKDGTRPMSARERIAEWDALTAQQRDGIIDKKGIQWYISQAEKIQRLREALLEIPPVPLDQPEEVS